MLKDWNDKKLISHLPHAKIFESITTHWACTPDIDEKLKTRALDDFSCVLAPVIDRMHKVSLSNNDYEEWLRRVHHEALLGYQSAGTDKLWAAAMSQRPLKPLVHDYCCY